MLCPFMCEVHRPSLAVHAQENSSNQRLMKERASGVQALPRKGLEGFSIPVRESMCTRGLPKTVNTRSLIRSSS